MIQFHGAHIFLTVCGFHHFDFCRHVAMYRYDCFGSCFLELADLALGLFTIAEMQGDPVQP